MEIMNWLFRLGSIIVILVVFIGCANVEVVQNSYGGASYVKTGIEYLKKNDYKSASVEFNKALGFDLQNSSVQFLNALVYHLFAEKGNSSQYQYAEIGYKLALKFDQNNWLASRQLAFLYLKTKKFRLSQKYAVETLFFRPKDIDMLYVLAYSSYFLHNRDLALWSLKEAYKLDKSNPIILRALAIVYASIGDFKESEIFLERYFKLVNNKSDLEFLKRRISDWKYFYSLKLDKKDKKETLKEERKDDSEDIDYNMVNIDVVIIGAHQQINKQTGINLFDGLAFQFGRNINIESSKMDDYIDPMNSTDTYSKSITTALSIPDIKYSLNIFNNDSENYSIIAKPTLVALNEHQSEYFSGDTMHIGLISSGDYSSSEIVDIPIGVKLVITPKFISKNKMLLDLEAERTTIDETGTGGTFQSVVWTSKKHVHVNAVLEYGDTLIVGGLNEKEMQDSGNKTPLLGDIPGVKNLFATKGLMNWTRSDLILLTPKKVVVNNKKEENLKKDYSFLDDLKKIYPNWKFKKDVNSQRYIQRQFRSNDLKYIKWFNEKSIDKLLQNIYL